MPTSTQDIRTEYPLPVYNYRVEIGPDAVAFSEVSGLNIAYVPENMGIVADLTVK